MKNRKIEQAS